MKPEARQRPDRVAFRLRRRSVVQNYVERGSNDSGCTVSVRVEMIHLTLSLKVLMWVPNAAPGQSW